MMTYEEAAKVLRVSTLTLRRLVAQGEIRHVWSQGQVRILRKDLDDYLEGQAR